MSENRGFAHAGQLVAVTLCALAAECILLRLFFVHSPQWGALLASHAGVIAALVLWLRYSAGIRSDVRIPLLLIASTAALGPLGPVGSLAAMLLARWHMRSTRPFEEWYHALFPDSREEALDEFTRTIADADPESPASLAPFAEILAFGSLHQKQALIALIDQSFRPAFGPVLRRALMDETNAIRVQAATVMNKIEDRMHAQTLELSRRVAENPTEAEAIRALARHYDQCVYSRILDAHRESETRANALEAWRRYVAARPGDTEAQIAISRLLLRGGQCEEAAGWLEKTIRAGGASSQAELWYMESLYNLGRFAELRDYAGPRRERIESSDQVPQLAVEAVQLWAEAPRQ